MEEQPIENPIDRRALGVAAQIRSQAMRYPELKHSQIARRVGCSQQNVHAVLKRFFKDDQDVGLPLDEYREHEVALIARVRQMILSSITMNVIEKAPLAQRLIAFGIGVDKGQLLGGNPTSITVSQMWDCVEVIREMRDAQDRQ